MGRSIKAILIVSLLNLINCAIGQKVFPRSVPVSCGSIHEVTPQLQYTFNNRMLTNFRGHVVDLNPFKNSRVGQYMRTKVNEAKPFSSEVNLSSRLSNVDISGLKDFSDVDDEADVTPKRASTFLSRNNIIPPESSHRFPDVSVNFVNNDDKPGGRENSIPNAPTPELSRDDSNDYIPETFPSPPTGFIPGHASSPRGRVDQFNSADVLSSIKRRPSILPIFEPVTDKPATDALDYSIHPESSETKIKAPSIVRSRFNLDDILRNVHKKQASTIPVEDKSSHGKPAFLSSTPSDSQEEFKPPAKDDSRSPQFNKNHKDEGETAALPPYILRILESKAKNPLNHPTQKPKPVLRPSPQDNKGGVNPQDILQSLGPDKLEQLRQLLNAAAGPFGPPLKEGSVSNTELLHTLADQQRFRFRSRRRRDVIDYSGDSTKCSATFKKGSNCEKLVVRIQHWKDDAHDCNKEYLLIQDDQKLERLCEFNEYVGPVFTVGDKVTVEHFLKASAGKINFSGVIECTSN